MTQRWRLLKIIMTASWVDESCFVEMYKAGSICLNESKPLSRAGQGSLVKLYELGGLRGAIDFPFSPLRSDSLRRAG